MKNIVVLGAGRSSSSLIDYLISYTASEGHTLTVGDLSVDAAREKVANSSAHAIPFDIDDHAAAHAVLKNADVAISMLPPAKHTEVAKICIDTKTHLLTASYVSPEMQVMHAQAVHNDLLFLSECGLDPGIDHMSAMEMLAKIHDAGGKVISFQSFTGGLISPHVPDENPWQYKFTWNPRNVVTAGQGVARYLEQGSYKYIPYQRLFSRVAPIHIPGWGMYEGYANRDSLRYRELYGLNEVETLQRGTLRKQGFCAAWNIFVQLGCCDDSYEMHAVADMTHESFFRAFLPSGFVNLEDALVKTFSLSPAGEVMEKLRWAGCFSNEPVGIKKGTPARILEAILHKRWRLSESDKDLILMIHLFEYEINRKRYKASTSLGVEGTSATKTAMAKTVGLPLAIAAKLLLNGQITARGVVIPVLKEIYRPILDELRTTGIALHEEEYD